MMARLHGITMGLDVCATFHMGISPSQLREITSRVVMRGAPSYLMAVAGNADPMLGYLTTSFREHPRLRRAVDAVRPFVERRAQQLFVDLVPDDVTVTGDLTRLEQVVRNLLDNAVKYTDAGGGITVRVASESGDAVVTVGDTGAGIRPELLARIFDPFVQGAASSAQPRGGLGLGLTLVKQLVELHGGTVSARSAGPGRGSEFEVRLPLTPASPGEAAAGPPPPLRRSLRILVVEDQPDTRQSLRMLLEEEGHRVKAVTDARRAVDGAVVWAPDVVLLDIALPGTDGYAAARRIRRRLGRAVRLVALTGYGQPTDRARSAAVGFDAHLVKPVDGEQLLAALATLSARR